MLIVGKKEETHTAVHTCSMNRARENRSGHLCPYLARREI